ncbi:glycine cleavage system protein R [Aestuariibacter salexigens]|uniref:glycine cleavage system protein R n=1 Tax=Aestuariibacter salexigens TaxID=226010 RepID=UPI0003F57B7B|nr:ACT domain-containing protein [Aestuariibacter salexigens]
MQTQLIMSIMGTDRPGALSSIASAVSDLGCSILDSRQAIYGQDFSVTMILEGSHSAITRAELTLPSVCHSLDLLAMMKRTSQHSKQNLDHLLDVEFSGRDAVGLLKTMTQFFSDRDVSISALRQKAYADETHGVAMRCKLVVNAADSCDIEALQQDFAELLEAHGLVGKIVDKQQKENHENTSDWG